MIHNLSTWKGESVDKQTLLEYLQQGNYIVQLTEIYRKLANIPGHVRLEKIAEVYEVPDMSGLLSLSEQLGRMRAVETESYFQSDADTVEPPKITDTEEKGIMAKYSFFVGDEAGLKNYMALKLLCEVTNLVNNDIEAEQNTPIIGFRAAKHFIPRALKFLKKSHPNPKSSKYVLEVDYPALK